jgi:hypothetical protein
MRWATRLVSRAALALLALGLWACARESPAEARPTVRFECQEGCGSYKTVFPGETPPACCGAPMERSQEGERAQQGAGQSAAHTPAGED